MRSMTGYATRMCVVQDMQVTLEIKSVNHRFLDVFVKLPGFLNAYEYDIRDIVQKQVRRGKVLVTVTVNDKGSAGITVNDAVIAKAVKALRKVQKTYTLAGTMTISDVLQVPNVFTVQNERTLSPASVKTLKKELGGLLEAFVQMKQKEGRALQKDIVKRLSCIDEKQKGIAEKKEEYCRAFEARFKEKLAAYGHGVEVDQERIAKEVAFLIERSDITEELVRLASHLALFRDTALGDAQEECGKQLDFILQEMNREVNTIASKAQQTSIIHEVVTIKSEVEKIREQIQNIE